MRAHSGGGGDVARIDARGAEERLGDTHVFSLCEEKLADFKKRALSR
eukprot:SAG11_NODE_25787_length_354_cov_0.607843_2_plen_47_part_01